MSQLLLEIRTQDLPPSTVHTLADAAAPLTFLDRVALRLGLWLLLRSTRRAERHDVHSRRVSLDRDRVIREIAVIRLHQLGPRP